MYEIKNIILQNDCIGNSLSTMNLNFDTLENWTNSILLSSKNLFEPLVDFYKFYGDFWKSSINFSESINAIQRLTEFNTQVSTNSAIFIKPIVIIYPDIFQYDSIYIENYKNTVISWFKSNYPVEDLNNSETLFVENTVAFVYMMFYTEEVKVNNTLADNNRFPIGKTVTCSTNNVSTTVSCRVTYKQSGAGVVSCVDYEPQIMDNVCRGNTTICTQTKEAKCSFENGAQIVSRTGRLNVDQYFKDRSEYEKIFILKMVVKECEWVLDQIIPYYE